MEQNAAKTLQDYLSGIGLLDRPKNVVLELFHHHGREGTHEALIEFEDSIKFINKHLETTYEEDLVKYIPQDDGLERLRGCTIEHLQHMTEAEILAVQFATFEQLEQIILDWNMSHGQDQGWGVEGSAAYHQEVLQEIADLAGLNSWPKE